MKAKKTVQKKIQKITPFLWFDDRAEEAAKFYVSIFKDRNSKILSISDMMVTFRLLGQELMALNGGPTYKFTPAISLFVSCKSQKEVDMLWEKLSKGGKEGNCGWLTDKYGLSWQIIPNALGELMSDENEEKSGRVFQAMLKMGKIDVKKLERAYAGK
jgi:predicted 3-demethylubiquinone-9 3-methyltransferase (glyoxalase superfamily)